MAVRGFPKISKQTKRDRISALPFCNLASCYCFPLMGDSVRELFETLKEEYSSIPLKEVVHDF